MKTKNLENFRLLSSIIIIIGGFLPWFIFSSSIRPNIIGYELPYGFITTIVGIFCVPIIYDKMNEQKERKFSNYIIISLSLVCLFCIMVMISIFSEVLQNEIVLGYGAWLSMGGSILLALTSLLIIYINSNRISDARTGNKVID